MKNKTDLNDLLDQSEKPDFWQNPTKAQMVMKQISDLRVEIDSIHSLKKRISDSLELAKMEDASIQKDLESELISIENALDELGVEHSSFRPL